MSRLRRRSLLEPALLVLLFLLALAIRLYGLHQWPPGLYNDEAANGLDALGVLAGRRPLFFAGNNGREPLFIYLQAVSIALFGATPYALRLTAAVVGALTVPAVYWMTRAAFARTTLPARWLALWTALFLAVSYWHISLSRVGFRAIIFPLMAALAFGWFWRAWWKLDQPGSGQVRQARTRLPLLDLVLCGLFVGLSLYTYTAARFLPLVIGIVAIAGALLTGSRQRAGRIGLGLGVIAATAVLVFAPLGVYYLAHPGAFLGRAASVSVLSSEFAAGGPLASLVTSVVETAKMFFTTPDPNLRHNPAQRPVFDVVLAAWFAVGIVIALFRWRILPYFFAVVWLMLLAAPAVLSSEGIPHSLRAVGMLPVSIMLAVLAMLAVGQRLLSRWRWLALCLPLPFLLFSGYTGLRDYFQAWENIDRFRADFQVEYVDLARSMAAYTERDSVWILPISPNYRLSDAEFYTMEFFALDRFGSVLVHEQDAPTQLVDVTAGKRTARLISFQSLNDASSAYVFGDPKRLLEFLLRKHGRVASPRVEGDSPFAYQDFDLPLSGEFKVADGFTPLGVSFADKIMLTDAAFGRTAVDLREPADALNSRTLPSGHPLWIALHWQATTSIDVDLKASLYLKDSFGNIAGQADDLLVSDRYPTDRVWRPGETAGTYHILPTLPAIAPGRYALYLKVYEDQTLLPYPVADKGGEARSPDALLGYVDVTRPVDPVSVRPETPLPSETRMGPDLALLGYDLPMREARPGDSLPLTLYWQSSNQPARDYGVRVELRDASNRPVVSQEMSPANDTYPTSQWQQHDIVRDWHQIPLNTSLASGVYDLAVVITDGEQALAEESLGQVTVKGRVRQLEPPSLAAPLSADFGNRVALLGVVTPEKLQVAPGDIITVTVAWQALTTPAEEIVRFVHVLGPDGRPVSQMDGTPCNGDCPSTSWLPGEVIVDEISLRIPADLPAGSYPLGVGWYDSATLQRLAARDSHGQAFPDDLVILPLRVDISTP